MLISIFGTENRADVARIDQYREVFAAAVKQQVRRTGLPDNLDDAEAMLIERMNSKRLKAGFNTDWEGNLWSREA